jgi:outer membrane biosynthesis protein TonB
VRRRFDPFDRRSMALSAALHAAVIALAWASTVYEPNRMEFITYEIELVSPPPARQAEEPQPAREELVVERPDPEPIPPEPEVEEIVPVEVPEPEPEPDPPVQPTEPVEVEPPEVADDPVVATTEDPPEVEPEVSGEGLNVRMEGLRRDYPEYYNNIIRQIQRCHRWRDGGSWETTIFFYIDRDGNAQDIRFDTRSGNTSFDFEAMGAVECAGQGRFGPLPDDLPYDRFPIRFSFRPMGETIVHSSAPSTPTEVTPDR